MRLGLYNAGKITGTIVSNTITRVTTKTTYEIVLEHSELLTFRNIAVD